jgi:hypothetical protein
MPDKKQSIILGGLVVGLLSTSYLGMINQACCLGVLIGAALSVWHYTTENDLTLKTGTGAGMGSLAALFGWGLATVLTWALTLVGIGADKFTKRGVIEGMEAQLPPEQADVIIPVMEDYFFVVYIVGILSFALFGAIGGAIATKMFKKGGDEPTDFDAVVAAE